MTRLNLVTGATGFSGSYVIRELLATGGQVIGTDTREALQDREHLDVVSATGLNLNHPNLEIIAADLLEPSSLIPVFQRPVTHIFHTASLYNYSAPLAKLRRLNVDGTRNLVGWAERANLERFIHWSTCGVYGRPFTAAEGVRANIPFTERSFSPWNTDEAVAGPPGSYLVNDYSVSKWDQEKVLLRAHRDGQLPVTVIRPAPIYGPGSSYGHGGLILTIALGYLPVVPLDARNHITASVHVEDVARFACYIATREDALGQDYNVVDNSVISYLDFLSYIALLTGRALRPLPLIRLKDIRPLMVRGAGVWTWLERRLHIPRVRVLEVQSATYMSSSYWLSNRKSLSTGFSYRYGDVREGLKDTVAWFGEMGWLTDSKQVLRVNREPEVLAVPG